MVMMMVQQGWEDGSMGKVTAVKCEDVSLNPQTQVTQHTVARLKSEHSYFRMGDRDRTNSETHQPASLTDSRGQKRGKKNPSWLTLGKQMAGTNSQGYPLTSTCTQGYPPTSTYVPWQANVLTHIHTHKDFLKDVEEAHLGRWPMPMVPATP